MMSELQSLSAAAAVLVEVLAAATGYYAVVAASATGVLDRVVPTQSVEVVCPATLLQPLQQPFSL